MERYRKAVVATVGAAVAIAATFGVNVPEEVSTSVVTLVTAVLVLVVPNAE